MTRFVPGLRLARTFYEDAVRPILDEHFPYLPHTAALLGPGSEVLGFDDRRSTDHDWGPRLQLFLRDADAHAFAATITSALARHLPESWHGYPTAFTRTHDPDTTPRHRVEVTDLATWFATWLGFDPRTGITSHDWLATPTQRLAEITRGAVFHDGLDELLAARTALRWYPDDLWRYILACQWHRIAQEEAFPGRCAETGDELGSIVVTARLVRDLMRLCLLIHQRYPTYSKWLGTDFAHLPQAGDLSLHLSQALTGPDWPTRETHLTTAYQTIAGQHNALGLTEPLEIATRPFYDRPYRVLDADRFTTALRADIEHPEIRHRPVTGAIDQFVDNTDALGDLSLTRTVSQAGDTSG